MKKFIYGAMSFGLLFSACTQDVLTESSESSKRNVDRTYYLNVAIHGDSDAFTRSAADDGNPDANQDFSDGSKVNIGSTTYDESEVTTVYFVFYDKDGNVVGDLVQANELTWETENAGETVEKYGQTIVQIDVPKASNDPAYVVCYINPIAPQSLQFDLASIQTSLISSVWRSDYGFAMSNSVYYDSSTSTKPEIAVPINDSMLKESYDAAKADTNAAMDIYVERYAAKLSFSVQDGVDEDYTTTSPVISSDGTTSSRVEVSLHFNQLKWALNAEAKNTYIIKSFRKESPLTGQILPDNYTFAQLNKVITSDLSRDTNGDVEYTGGSETEGTTQWKWNAPSYKRSYWAMSPAYFTNTYPEVASDIQDMGEDVQQVYYTYNDLNKSGLGFDMSTTTGYFKETTVGSIALTSNNPKAAVASVILTGQYSVTVNGTEYNNETFYTYNKSTDGKDLVFFDDNNGESVISGTQSMISRFISATSILFVRDENGNYVQAKESQIYPYVEIGKHELSTDIAEGSTNHKISSRLRTMVLKSSATTETSGLYVATPSGYKSIIPNSTENNGSTVANVPGTDEMTLDQANENIYQQVNTCVMYKDGMAYFNIPVMHFGWYRSDNPNKDKALSDIEWKDVHVGDFGIVRNHAYNVVVSELKGLGTGIADGDDPIVPPADTESYYVKYRVNILKWAVVPTQSVKL